MNDIYKGVDLSFGHQLLRGGGKGSPEHLHGLVDSDQSWLYKQK
jgi:hypothetical protein